MGVEDLDVFEDGGFGFVGEGEFGEVGEGREEGGAAVLEEGAVEERVVVGDGGGDDGVGGLEGLDENGGLVEMTAADATDDLGEEVEGALFGGEVGEGEAGVGLDDADSGEFGEVETFGDGLGADENVDFAEFEGVKAGGDGFGFFVVGVEAGDVGIGEEGF